MNILKYVKSLVYEEEIVGYKWVSGLICFVDDGKMVLDRGFIITGNISPDYFAFYANFRNFTLINDDLHYMYPDSIKKINPDKVYLHVKFGSSPYSIPLTNPTYWNLYFNTPNNKLYKSLTITPERIKIIENTNDINYKIKKVSEITCPLFDKRQVYNETSILFSGINTDIF
jgi:hypothetical protein